MSRKYYLDQYKSLAICDYNSEISRLRKLKVNHMKEMEELDRKIRLTEEKKRTFCKVTSGGHTLREELEDGIYGDRYYVCTTCGLEV